MFHKHPSLAASRLPGLLPGQYAVVVKRAPAACPAAARVARDCATLGEWFQHSGLRSLPYGAFNIVVREILVLGEGFNTQVITLSPLPIAYKLVWHTLYGVSTWCSSEEHSHPIHHKNAHAYPSGHESTSIYDRVQQRHRCCAEPLFSACVTEICLKIVIRL